MLLFVSSGTKREGSPLSIEYEVSPQSVGSTPVTDLPLDPKEEPEKCPHLLPQISNDLLLGG